MTTTDTVQRNADLVYRLRGLGMAGAVLHIGAHPDDEDVGLLAYLPRKFGVRTVYWSATRGEGGQNRIGPYKEEALGIYRTWESLAARARDGGECLFGPFYDYGFSKNGDEALSKWGRRALVREVVRAIRLVQPHIVVVRFTGEPRDGHGHHQAVGRAALEALELAGDQDAFPELQMQGLAAWQPLKLYHSTTEDWQPGEDGSFGTVDPKWERAGVVRINSGEFDPIAGRTFQEQAWMAFNKHQTQAIGFLPTPDDYFYYFALHKSLASVPDQESSLFDGLDPSLTGLTDYPGDESAALRTALEQIKAHVHAALQEFRVEDPMLASTDLLDGLALLRDLHSNLTQYELIDEARLALDMYLARKIVDFEAVTAQCLGLKFECLSETAHVIPGQSFQISAQLWNQRGSEIDEATFALQVPAGWETRPLPSKSSAEMTTVFEVTVSETTDLALTGPYWLAEPREPYFYHWPVGEPAGRAFGPAQIQVTCEVAIGAHRLNLQQAAVRREAFPGGFRELPLVVIPPISLHPGSTQEFLPVKADKRRPTARSEQDVRDRSEFLEAEEANQRLELKVVARNNSEQAVEGSLRLEAPDGWTVSPQQVKLSLETGGAETVGFSVTVPADTPQGHYPLHYKIRYGQRDYADVLTPVQMAAPGLSVVDGSNCVKEEFIITPARVMVHLISAQFVADLRYAYIQGVEDELTDILQPFGLTWHLIEDAEMGYIDLNQFDAVVVGHNAYLVRNELRKYAGRFVDYIHQGGTLIVQYQGYDYQKPGLSPYPINYSQPHDRVTNQDAPVTILDPEHMLFRLPNVIRASDFDDWVRDRGLYFFGQWDKHYHPLLACSDPGEEPKEGGLLICQYGRGTYLYTGYSFFRQIPAAVAGAFRLFANILALPAAVILERAEFLKNIPLFSFMKEEQLEAVARIMSEKWLEDGEYLCHQEDDSDELYVITEGEVDIVKQSSSGDQVIYMAKRGELIGEMGVLGKRPRTSAMQAKGDVHLLVIEGAHFQSIMHKHPEMYDGVIQILVDKLAATGG